MLSHHVVSTMNFARWCPDSGYQLTKFVEGACALRARAPHGFLYRDFHRTAVTIPLGTQGSVVGVSLRAAGDEVGYRAAEEGAQRDDHGVDRHLAAATSAPIEIHAGHTPENLKAGPQRRAAENSTTDDEQVSQQTATRVPRRRSQNELQKSRFACCSSRCIHDESWKN